jgi:hypothetical protein
MTTDNFNGFIHKLQSIAKQINSRSVNDRLARKCKQIIYRRVKNGYGVNSDRLPAERTTETKLKPLSRSYVAFREGRVAFFRAKDGHVYPVDLKKYGKKNKVSFKPTLGLFGRPNKSNATFSGEMMESINLRYSSEGFQLLIMNSKRGDDSGLTNLKVNQYYSADRPYFALTQGEVRILTRELEKIVKEIIERNF